MSPYYLSEANFSSFTDSKSSSPDTNETNDDFLPETNSESSSLGTNETNSDSSLETDGDSLLGSKKLQSDW